MKNQAVGHSQNIKSEKKCQNKYKSSLDKHKFCNETQPLNLLKQRKM